MLVTANSSPLTTRRLLVLLPDVDFNVSRLAQRLCEITSLQSMTVVLLGSAAESIFESRMRQRLATLAAMMREECAQVEIRFTKDQDSAHALHDLYQSGDVIVCHEEQKGKGGVSLSRDLESTLRAPVYVLRGLYPPKTAKDARFVSRAIRFAVPVILVLGFLGIQIPIDRATSGMIHVALLSLSVLAEYALLTIWNIMSSIM